MAGADTNTGLLLSSCRHMLHTHQMIIRYYNLYYLPFALKRDFLTMVLFSCLGVYPSLGQL